MKQLVFTSLFTLITLICFGQSDGPKQITADILQQIKADVEKQIPAYKQQMAKNDFFTIDRIEFSLDTFRIKKICAKRMDIDYSTAGMNTNVIELTAAYDKLMNKYYNKLLKLLKPEDKAALITAQKAWLVYRDAEAKLIGTMIKTEYSGGGTMQSNIANGSYSDLVVTRTIDIFNYYDTVKENSPNP